MTHSPNPEPSPPAAPPPAVEVDVARSGGIAGITRRWSAQPVGDEASEWISLIDRCPWDDAAAPGPEPAPGAAPTAEDDHRRSHRDRRPPVPDGFTWWIRATWSDSDPREAELVDDEVVGAWRDLVDAVRDWSRRSSDGR